MCNGNYLFCIERKHVDWSCAMEMFFWQEKKQRHTLIVHVQWKLLFFERRKKQRNVWMGHVQWKCFFGKKKSRDTLWLFMCSGNCFFFCERRKKQRNVWIDHVQWTFVFLREKSKETSTSIMCSGIFLRGNAWFDHAQWTFVFWQKTCGFSMCWMLPHPWLFSNHSVRDGTIGAPIKYGKLDASSQ